jgi:pulcherriminic acid synthase
MDCSDRLHGFLLPIIQDRYKRPGNDFVSLLCRAEAESERRSMDNVVALCLNALLAATEPTDKTLSFLFYHLVQEPGRLRRAREDREFVSDLLAETLRFNSPVQLVPRKTTQPVEIAGVKLPPGAAVFCMIGAANRDPDIFENPDVFLVGRQDLATRRSFTAAASHMAFGAGMHACVGAAFGRAEIVTIAQVLLERMRGLRFADDFVYEETGFYTRGPRSLTLEFDPTE